MVDDRPDPELVKQRMEMIKEKLDKVLEDYKDRMTPEQALKVTDVMEDSVTFSVITILITMIAASDVNFFNILIHDIGGFMEMDLYVSISVPSGNPSVSFPPAKNVH